MSILRDLVVDTCLTGTLSIESSTDSDSVLSFYIEPINIKSVLVVFRVFLSNWPFTDLSICLVVQRRISRNELTPSG